MPLYYFHTDSHSRVQDNEGVELADIRAARANAAKSVAELLRGDADHFWGSRPWTMTVTDDQALILFTLEIDGQSSPATGIGR